MGQMVGDWGGEGPYWHPLGQPGAVHSPALPPTTASCLPLQGDWRGDREAPAGICLLRNFIFIGNLINNC